MPETVVHFQIRMPPSLHEQLATRARDDKTSLNLLIVAILRDAAERRDSARAKALPAASPSR
jgi:predicted HicB family RNase H-like nuclease